MQSAMCYMGLVTCYVKALLSMGKQGTKSFARDFQLGTSSMNSKVTGESAAAVADDDVKKITIDIFSTLNIDF